MTNMQKILFSPEIQEKIFINSRHLPLDMDKKRRLASAYMKLYFGLSCMNWANKKNLGTAWQTALGQMQNFIDSKDKKNPAVQFLALVHNEHKKNWPKHIMTHPQRDSVLTGDKMQIAQWQLYAQKQIQSAMGEITLLTVQNTVDFAKGKEQPRPSQTAKPLPQTKNGEMAPANRGVNSTTPPAKQPGVNSSQATMKPREKTPGLARQEELKKQAQQKIQQMQKQSPQQVAQPVKKAEPAQQAKQKPGQTQMPVGEMLKQVVASLQQKHAQQKAMQPQMQKPEQARAMTVAPAQPEKKTVQKPDLTHQFQSATKKVVKTSQKQQVQNVVNITHWIQMQLQMQNQRHVA